MTDQIEMWWKCSACGTTNGGLSKKCGERIVKHGKVVTGTSLGCGKYQEREPWFMPCDISKKANITDSKELEKARAGVDWYCGYCGSTQRRSDGECSVCGGNKGFSTEDRDGKSKFVDTDKKYVSETKSFNKKVRRFNLKNISIIAIIGIIILLFIYFLTPRYVDAKVESVNWVGVITVERFKRIHDEGWDAPSDAEDVVSEGSKIHHYDHVKVGSHIESYTERVACGQDCTTESIPRSCSSNGNGTASCTGGGTMQSCSTRYCDETRYRTVDDYEDKPRYRMWYSWYAWRWRFQRDVKSFGNNLKLQAPTEEQIALNIGCIGKESERKSLVEYKYECKFFDKEGKSYIYQPTTEVEFKNCINNRSAVLKLAVNGVSIEKWK